VFIGELVRLREARYIASCGKSTRYYRVSGRGVNVVNRGWVGLWRFSLVVVYINLVYSYGFAGYHGVWLVSGGVWIYLVLICLLSYIIHSIAMNAYNFNYNLDVWCGLSLINLSIATYLCVANIFIFIFILECQGMLLLYLLGASGLRSRREISNNLAALLIQY
jgi:hypothetical protein